jgi:(p)ppGpp synthase/HD superfamily hydrolase
MGTRVVRTAQELGVAPSDLTLIERVHQTAMAVRDERADDDHDPQYLHPGRSALILLQDLGETDALTLAVTLIFDSAWSAWTPSDREVDDARLSDLRGSVPKSGDEDLAERLVVGDDRVRRIALAERLDHLRHAHLWSDREARRLAHEEAVGVYAPVADRTHPDLSRRYAWWCRMFGARHLR